jgi:AmmeMemoRadiSam system protein B
LFPKLRPLEATPFEREGRGFVRLRDPLGVAPRASLDGGLVLPAAHFELARGLDGSRTLAESGERAGVSRAEAEALHAEWSAELLLEDAGSRSALDEALELLRASAHIPARGAGRDYEADPFALRVAVAGMVADDWDMPPPADVSGLWVPASGLRGRSALFARAYAAVRHHAASFERVLFLASVPARLASDLIVLDRPLETPMGVLAVDIAAKDLLPVPRGHDLLAHGHSRVLERHGLFLRLLFPRLPVVAVLVPAPRADDAPPHAALEQLRGLSALKGRSLLIAAGDLSELAGSTHPAPSPPQGRGAAARRGAEGGASPGVLVAGGELERLRAQDAARIDSATRMAADELWELTQGSHDALARATAPVPWLALRLLADARSAADAGPVRGSLLGYQQSSERTGLVSAASVVFH